MDEYKEVMGSNWADSADQQFEDLDPLKAMDKLKLLAQTGGDKAINNDPKSLQLIRTVAHVSDADISRWVNRWVPDHNPKMYSLFDEEIKEYRDTCRKALGLEPYKSKVN